MTKGLKEMVAEAVAEQVGPVEVSPEAIHALSRHARSWSGWDNAVVKVGQPTASPWADCQHVTRTFTVNADKLVLNPHRVLLTVTPFRLRQEAVLTGALMHEAGHARFTQWIPRTAEEAQAKPMLHSDGSEPTKATVKLARLMEEPRVEALIAGMSDRIAPGLDWTMRASAAHLLPTTALSMDPDRAIMDLITSWALRAGRQYGLAKRTSFTMRHWAKDFTALVERTLVAHLEQFDTATANTTAQMIMRELFSMIDCEDHTGPTMVDSARDVLALLFPETPPEEQPEAGEGCTSEEKQPEDESEQSEDQPEEGSEGSESDDEDSEAAEDEETPAEPSDEGDSEDVSDESDTESDSEGEEGEDGESEDGESEDGGDSDGEPEDGESEGDSPGTDTESELAEALAELEAQASSETEDEAEELAEADPALGAGAGEGDGENGGWRKPTPEEREIQRGAERFLRDLIAPSEASRIALSESPSATVDAGEMAAWKAGGQIRDPRFFRRIHRTVQPSAPVKIAVLVDVSGSMDALQKPSAILSWALAAAAVDLQNFAGRGQQVESCLIHWGDSVRVIQKNGEILPGIREFGCWEGTSAMPQALDKVAEEIPGFFDQPARPENRLLVQFTDWELNGTRAAAQRIGTALAAGVNMLSVVPGGRWGYSLRNSVLPHILKNCPEQRGRTHLMKYNPMFPSQVWDEAAQMLAL